MTHLKETVSVRR